MIHTKAQGHWPFGSGEEDFWRVFTIYWHGGHLGHVTQMPQTNFRSPDQWRLHVKFGFDWPSGFGEEDLWKWWTDGRQRTPTDDGRTDDGACLYYKLTNEPKGSGELTKICYWTEKKTTRNGDRYERFRWVSLTLFMQERPLPHLDQSNNTSCPSQQKAEAVQCTLQFHNETNESKNPVYSEHTIKARPGMCINDRGFKWRYNYCNML